MYNYYLWKGFFLSDIIKKYNFKKYLELGINKAETWDNIKVNHKIGVDSNPNCQKENVLNTTTDEYFENLDKDIKYDLIFIDACHEKVQVKNDFLNSFEHLEKNGIIVLHDIFPINEWETRQEASGDCYNFWISLVDNYPQNCYTFTAGDNDTIGIFFKNDLTKIDPDFFKEMNQNWSYLFENKVKYLLSIRYEM